MIIPWALSLSVAKALVDSNGSDLNKATNVTNSTLALPPPTGGDQSNPPSYNLTSDFDFESINLALHQEYIELDLFHHGLARFSVDDFEKSGLNAEDRYLIQFMADQEEGHAKALTNIMGVDRAPKQCNYTYPFTDVPTFIDFCQKLTRFGESGVYGFLPHMDSRSAAQILLQSITTEARQQMIFRQFEGLFPMPVFFETGVPQSFAWTLLAPYITSCPPENPLVKWNNFPALTITNNPIAHSPNISSPRTVPAITHNRTALSYPGREVHFSWESPGKTVGPSGNYVTRANATEAKFVAWIAQYNTTYTPLENISGNTGTTKQPGGTVYPGMNDPIINGTMFVAIVDTDLFVTPYNLSLINNHVVAGPALYLAS